MIRCLLYYLKPIFWTIWCFIHKCVIYCCKPPEYFISWGLCILRYCKNWFDVAEGIDDEEKELNDGDEDEDEEEYDDDEIEDDIAEDEFNTYDELDLVNQSLIVLASKSLKSVLHIGVSLDSFIMPSLLLIYVLFPFTGRRLFSATIFMYPWWNYLLVMIYLLHVLIKISNWAAFSSWGNKTFLSLYPCF